VGADQEREWVLGAREGDQECFGNLVQAFQGPVYNLAYRMLGNSAEAEDAAQETFLRVYRRLDSYDPQRKLSSWILSIASHYCIDCLRKRRGVMVSMEEINSWRWVPDDRPKPEERVMDVEASDAMRQMLDGLPPQYRLVIVLRYWQDLSYAEISEVTGASISAVKSRLHRARQMMATQVKESEQYQVQHTTERRESVNALSRSF